MTKELAVDQLYAKFHLRIWKITEGNESQWYFALDYPEIASEGFLIDGYVTSQMSREEVIDHVFNVMQRKLTHWRVDIERMRGVCLNYLQS
jgi:hypothetical protein